VSLGWESGEWGDLRGQCAGDRDRRLVIELWGGGVREETARGTIRNFEKQKMMDISADYKLMSTFISFYY
jgi:hypothetical protein